MTNIRLLPVVVFAIAALLVLKTVGLVTNGGYVLTGVRTVQAAGGGGGGGGEGGNVTESDATLTLPQEPTLQDTSPTMADPSPTMGQQSEAGGHGAAAAPAGGHGEEPAAEGDHGDAAADDHEATSETLAADHDLSNDASHGVDGSKDSYCVDSDAAIDAEGNVIINPASDAAAAAGDGHGGSAEPEIAPRSGDPMPVFAESMADCLPSGDAVPLLIDGKGGVVPLMSTDAASETEQLLLQRLAARRDELQKYEDDLSLRSSIVDAAEKRIEERAATLSALEAQISSLVDQREEMEAGQFAGIVAMYETMKPKDAANIFNNLDMNVLLRVAKTMSPRKMAPILAVMDTARAQELTVEMAALADRPASEMTPDALAALPQIVGQ